jgi:hypothetical protein
MFRFEIGSDFFANCGVRDMSRAVSIYVPQVYRCVIVYDENVTNVDGSVTRLFVISYVLDEVAGGQGASMLGLDALGAFHGLLF